MPTTPAVTPPTNRDFGVLRQLREARALLQADFAVNEPSDARVTLVVWRLGQAAHGMAGPFGFLLRRAHGLVDFAWTRVVIGAELPRSVSAGAGLILRHAGRGVILFPTVVLGSDVTLFHQVTIGIRGTRPAPRVEDGVYVGAGAKIIGDLTLGAGCRVGANAVVTSDVAPGTTVIGVPARPLVK